MKTVVQVNKPRVFITWGLFDAYNKLQGTVEYQHKALLEEYAKKKNAEIKIKNPLSKECFFVARIKNPVEDVGHLVEV